MSEIEVIKDLSNKKLCAVPNHVFQLPNLKMVYLENNFIEELPDELFTCLDKLSWLDVRNNKLKSIPKSIEFHPSLETLLLQNNFIEELPTELGLLPRLKALQLSDNPLKYPKKSVVERGVQAIVQFLKHEHIHKDSFSPRRESDKDDELEEKKFTNGRGILIPEKCAVKMPVMKLKSLHRLSDRNIRRKSSKTKNGVQKSNSKYKELRNTNSSKYQDMYSTKRDEYRIEEECMKELWMKKLKEIMNKQEELLQRERDFDALRNWRRDPKFKHQEKDATYRPEVPYDFNADYDRMQTRYEYQRGIEKSRPSYSTSSKMPQNMDVEKMISDICESLHSMELNHSYPETPKTQMDYAEREIKRILDLQKQLSALRISNDTCI